MSTARVQNSIRAGSRGAELGMSSGNPVVAVAGAVIGTIAGLVTPDYEGRAIKKYNDQVVKNAMEDLFDLRRVQNIRNIQTAQALQAYQDQRTVGTASINAQYGAAEALGTSSKALQQVLAFQTQEAQQQVKRNFEGDVLAYNQEVGRITNQGQAQLQRQRGQSAPVDASAMVKAGLDMYSKYNTSKPIKANTPIYHDNYKSVYTPPQTSYLG